MLVNRPSRRHATITTIVESLSSVLVGQLAFCSSPTSSLKKRRAERKGLAMWWNRAKEAGRRGGNRTPNQRFWRPLLYQLSYAPVIISFRRHSRDPKKEPRQWRSEEVEDALFDDLGDTTGTDGAAAFTDGELLELLHGDRHDELDVDGDVVARHDHLHALRQVDDAGHVRGTE